MTEEGTCLWCGQDVAPAATRCPHCGLEFGTETIKNALMMAMRHGYRYVARDVTGEDYLLLFSTMPTRHKDDVEGAFWGYKNEGADELPVWPMAIKGVVAPNTACEIADLIAPPELFQPLMAHIFGNGAQPVIRTETRKEKR